MTKSYPGRLTLGQLGKRVGLARSSVLHYESIGLLVPSARSSAGYRLYGEPELERLLTIRRLRDAGLALADIRTLLTSPDALDPCTSPGPGKLLERRLLGLCQAVERIREQQRLLAYLIALPNFRDDQQRWDKAAWVALLRRAGFDEGAMQRWHMDFERDNPNDHANFLRSIGLKPAEVVEIRRRSRSETGTSTG